MKNAVTYDKMYSYLHASECQCDECQRCREIDARGEARIRETWPQFNRVEVIRTKLQQMLDANQATIVANCDEISKKVVNLKMADYIDTMNAFYHGQEKLYAYSEQLRFRLSLVGQFDTWEA